MATTQKRKKQLAAILDQFYHNPVAQVSMELFLTVGLIIFLALFAIRPTLLTMSDLLKEIEDKKALQEQLNKKVAALGSAQSIYLTLENRLPLLDAAIPSTPETINSIKIIEKLATDEEIVLNSISLTEVPETPQTIPSFDKLSRVNLDFSLTVSGDYTSIKNFVAGILNSQRTFVVESIVFKIAESRGDKQLRASIVLKAPYFGSQGIANEKK